MIATLIPAYHLTLAEVSEILQRLPPTWETPVLVYNDSDDLLHYQLAALERASEISLVSIPYQVGKAEAIRRGLNFILSESQADIIVQLDGHLKQSPEIASQLVTQMIRTRADMIVLDRYEFQALELQMHRSTIAGLVSAIVEKLTGYRLRDVVCGTRGYVRDLGYEFTKLRCFGYGVELEEVLIASLRSCSVGACPTSSNRQADATNTEKIEDNLYVFINYAVQLAMPDEIRTTLSYMLSCIKKRISFVLDTSVFGFKSRVQFSYSNESTSIAGAYASGTSSDGYSLSIVE